MVRDGRELRSMISADGLLRLSLEPVPVSPPAEDEIIVRMEAAPINPSDLGLLLGPADISTLRVLEGGPEGLEFDVPASRLSAVQGRLGQSLPVGNEGAGTVVAAGRNVAHLEGELVGLFGGAMYADYRKISAREAIVLPPGARAADGASMYVNPLTALGFVETAKREGHRAIVHTAAASNLGQMLQKVCLASQVPLVNIVRSQEQVDILRGIGARHVVNSKDPEFAAQLADVLDETGATIAFDAVGGGSLGSDLLQAMELSAQKTATTYDRYGSTTFKQLYVYGGLDPGPVILNRMSFGFEWSVSGWLLPPFLRKIGDEAASRLRRRVVDELTTTFASHYTRTIGLAEALAPDVLRAYERKATGEKFLIDPTRG